MKHSVFISLILTLFSTISSQQQRTTIEVVTELSTQTEWNSNAIVDATTARSNLNPSTPEFSPVLSGNSPAHPGHSPAHPGHSPAHPGHSPTHPGHSPAKKSKKVTQKQLARILKQCTCKCKKKSKAKCVSKRKICKKNVCVRKCKRKSKKCHTSPTKPKPPKQKPIKQKNKDQRIKLNLSKIKISQELPSSEIRCGVKNDEHRTDEYGNILEKKYNNIFTPGMLPDSKIFGGKNANRGEWPWQVSLREKPKARNHNTLSSHFCGAVLIDSETVLTAAHCVWDCNSCEKGEGSFIRKKFIVALGFHKTSVTHREKEQIIQRDGKFGTHIQQVDTRKDHEKGEVIVHPDYKGEKYYKSKVDQSTKPSWMPNDIAIIKLRTPINFNKNSDSNLFSDKNQVEVTGKEPIDFTIGTYVRPICLPKPDHGIKPEIENKIWITGYGLIDSDRKARVLREGETNLISNEKCTSKITKHWGRKMHIIETQVCALSKMKKAVDTCQGDSGGPMTMSVTSDMIMENNKIRTNPQETNTETYNQMERYQLEGLTSWGFECGGKQPGVYTKVSQFMEFILKHSKHVQTVENEMLSI